MENTKKPTYEQLESWYQELIRQAVLDKINIHNKLGPERQPKETIDEYEGRLGHAQIVNGYSDDDYIHQFDSFLVRKATAKWRQAKDGKA